MKKRVLNAERLRKVPSQFYWIDHRLVQQEYFLSCDHPAWALYLFLTSVADAQGLSYYSDASLTRRLNMDPRLLSDSRQQLVQAGLIAYEQPLYQMLSPERGGTVAPGDGRPAMIDYHTYCQIRHLFTEKGLKLRQIARQLKLGVNTVRKWAQRQSYQRAPIPKRSSKLDPFKGQIVALSEQYDYSAQQILQRVKEQGYPGRYTTLRAFVQQVRPKPRPAFLTLHFEPGECAQVDWGCAGSVPVGSTRRRLSFFIMVLAFSRKLYVEFTLAETLEHFLARHQHAFEYYGGVAARYGVATVRWRS